MSILQRSEILGLALDTDIGHGASLVVDRVRRLVRETQNNPSGKEAEKEEKLIADIYQEFFTYSMQWGVQERKKHTEKSDRSEAERLREKGSAALTDLRENMVKFAICYLRLHRSMGFISAEMQKHEAAPSGDKKVTWTSETGTLLSRYKKERRMLTASNEKLAGLIPVLEDIESDAAKVESLSVQMLGEKSAEDVLRSFRAALRKGDFAIAKKKLAGICEAKKKFSLGKSDPAVASSIQKSGEAYIKLLESHKDDLSGEDGKMFLRARELSVIIAAQEKEIEQKTAYIEKYHVPYMEYKRKTLRHLREKLLIVGSLETLLTLYIRLIRGLVQPFEDMKAVRLYEEEVILHIDYLLTGQFQEMDNIEERNVQTMKEFYADLKEFEEYLN